jgi:hypothetical protein
MTREMSKQKGASVKSKKQKKLQRALFKAAGLPTSGEKLAAQILTRPIVPDVADVQKRAQGFNDFKALY